MPEKQCDQLIGELSEFIESKFTKRELRQYSESEASRENASQMILSFYGEDPVFKERMEPLVNCGSGDRWRLSALRESLMHVKRKLDTTRCRNEAASPVSGTEQVEVDA